MTVPTPSFGPNGFITPPESEILPAVEADINAAFGGNLNMSPSTPQGQLATSETAAIGNANDAFLFLSQQMDPAYNIGRYQDAIARIYFIERIPASPTVVNVTCGGLTGVVIPVNALVQDSSGNLYSANGSGTIDSGGTVTIEFSCITLGPIPCPAGAITTIFQTINGWDTVINAADGTLGQDTETRDAFERRRALSVAVNAQGSLPSVRGAVLSVPGVTDAYVTENDNPVANLIGGFTVGPNSLYVAVVGGLDADVAHAIWTKKSPGCGYNGNTTVVVQDTNSAYNPPLPSYDVKFERPASVTVTFVVTIENSVLVPADALTQVQNAIVNAFAGEDGGPRASIGNLLLASRYYGPVSALGTWAQILTIKIGCSSAPTAQFTGSISGSTLTITGAIVGIIAVGLQLAGAGVLPGTTIVSGTGLVWTVSNVQTVSSGAMTLVATTQDAIQIDIDQSPVTGAGNTQLVLI